MVYRKVLIFVVLVLVPLNLHAKTVCAGNEQVVGKCWKLRGRLQLYNGTPSLRIWQIGTNRLLGVVPPEEEIMPNDLKEKIAWGTRVFADYKVCPFTKRILGHMQMVCIESAENIKIERKLSYTIDN